VEDKKETLYFLTHLSLFNIRDVHVFVAKWRCALLWHVSDYTKKREMHVIMACLRLHKKREMHVNGTRCFLERKEDVSPFPYKGRRAFKRHVPISYPPYNAWFQLRQNSGGGRSCPVLTIFSPFWTRPSKILILKYNSCKS
jgi:hypothetical protein